MMISCDMYLMRCHTRRRAIQAGVAALRESTTFKARYIFGTLTYKEGVEAEPGHMRMFRRAFNNWAERRGFKLAGVWVAELHKSGKVHYHYVVAVPFGLRVPMPDKRGWWPHGMTRVEYIRKGAWSYLSKYVAKHAVITGIRTYGIFGLNPEGRRLVRLYRLPSWLKPLVTYAADVVREYCFFVDRVGRRWYKSPWTVFRRGSGVIELCKGEVVSQAMI